MELYISRTFFATMVLETILLVFEDDETEVGMSSHDDNGDDIVAPSSMS